MNKNYALLAATSAVLVVGVTALGLSSSPVRAQEAAQAATLPAPTAATTTTTTTATAPAAGGNVFVPASAPVTAGATPIAGSTVGTTGLMEAPQTPTVVNDAVNGLQKTDAINLDDMVRAQDAINRLDLLIEIEKRQSEIKKLRDERNKPVSPLGGSMGGSMGNAIPASALSLPTVNIKPIRSASSDDSSGDEGGFSSSSSGGIDKYSIRRIIGTNGRYAAVLSSGSDDLQTVHAGDKLSDGTVVKSVNLTSVSLSKGKKSRSLTIPSDSYISRE